MTVLAVRSPFSEMPSKARHSRLHIEETLAVKLVKYDSTLVLRKGPVRDERWLGGPSCRRTSPAIDGGWGHAQSPAGRPDAHKRGEPVHGLFDHLPVLLSGLAAPLGSKSWPRSAETFPWTSITVRAFSSSASALARRRFSSAFSTSKAGAGLRPRGCERASSAPWSLSRRQFVRWEE